MSLKDLILFKIAMNQINPADIKVYQPDIPLTAAEQKFYSAPAQGGAKSYQSDLSKSYLSNMQKIEKPFANVMTGYSKDLTSMADTLKSDAKEVSLEKAKHMVPKTVKAPSLFGKITETVSNAANQAWGKTKGFLKLQSVNEEALISDVANRVLEKLAVRRCQEKT